MNYREKMREYLKEPNAFSFQYGKWAMLNREQRTLIRRLLNEMDNADAIIRSQIDEIEKLNNRIDKAIEILKDYGDKEDIVGYTNYNITGEILINLLETLKGEANE